MSSFNWAEIASDVDAILADFVEGVLRVATTGGYDTETGRATSTNTDIPVFVAILEFTWRQAGTVFTPGMLIQAGDKHILMSAKNLPADPVPGNIVIAAGQTWTVMGVKSVAPAGVPVLYELLGRT